MGPIFEWRTQGENGQEVNRSSRPSILDVTGIPLNVAQSLLARAACWTPTLLGRVQYGLPRGCGL